MIDHIYLLDILHYSCLATIIVLSLSISLISKCTVRKVAIQRKSGSYGNAVISVIVLSYCAHAIALLFDAPPANKNQDPYLLSQVLFWLVLLMLGVIREVYLAVAPVLAAFEVSFAILDNDVVSASQWVVLACRIVRFISLLGLTATSARQIYHGKPGESPETRPLLANDADTTDAAVDSDDEDGPWIKKKQRERLEQSGTWWRYLLAYRVFLPYIWPQKDRALQLFLVLKVVIMLADRALGLLKPRQLGRVTDKLSAGDFEGAYREILIWLVFAVLESGAVLSAISQLLSERLSLFSYRQIVQSSFNHLMELSIDFHNDKDSAELIAAVNQGTGIGGFIDLALFEFLPSVLDLAIAFAYFNALFGFYVTFTVVLAAIFYNIISVQLIRWTRNSSVARMERSRKVASTINQAVQGWQTVVFFNRSAYESHRLNTSVKDLQASEWENTWKNSLGRAGESLVITLAYFVVLLIAAFKISRNEIPIGSFVILITYWGSLITPFMNFSWMYRYIQSELISAERLLLLLQMKPTVVDREGALPLIVTKGAIAFNDVGFRYDPRKATLSDINFTAKPGQTIALVGETGSGKSTMLRLLYRFYDVPEGSITIDGQDISNVTLRTLREALGTVDQHPYLFNISIMDNLRYGRLEATDEEIFEACTAAAIHEKILSFPDGYNTTVGDRGLKLSGGELQRIAIARVLLKDPKIVLLDEATSSVDTDTEVLIQTALKRLTRGRTTFVIAHRLSTIVSADLILVIQDGRIIQRGTHSELSMVEGKFKSLWSKQVAAATGDVVEDSHNSESSSDSSDDASE